MPRTTKIIFYVLSALNVRAVKQQFRKINQQCEIRSYDSGNMRNRSLPRGYSAMCSG